MNYAKRIQRELVLNGHHLNYRMKLARYLSRALYGSKGMQSGHQLYLAAAKSAFATEPSKEGKT